MAFISVFLTVFAAFYMAVPLDAASVSLSKNQLTLNGNANIQFYGPIEDVWAGLSNDHRFPTINSGDLISLRLAYTSSSLKYYWLYCTSSTCSYNTCGGTTMANKWSSCSSYIQFKITAMGKMDGQPINSGDKVTLGSKAYSYTYRLRCTASGYKCDTGVSISSMTGNGWLYYDYATFRIYSRNAVDGTPIQYADLVGLKYPYAGSSYWLSYYSSYFYAKSCSATSKTSCARQNYPAGFMIYKKL